MIIPHEANAKEPGFTVAAEDTRPSCPCVFSGNESVSVMLACVPPVIGILHSPHQTP